MKRYLFFVLSLMTMGVANAHLLQVGEQLPLSVQWEDPTPANGGHPRTPIARPSVAQDGHTLYFNNVGYDLELVLLDEDGEEAYAVFVPANTASVILPASLSGDYELQLLPGGSYYFYSEITL